MIEKWNDELVKVNSTSSAPPFKYKDFDSSVVAVCGAGHSPKRCWSRRRVCPSARMLPCAAASQGFLGTDVATRAKSGFAR